MEDLTYPEVGATRSDRLPAGYRYLRHRAYLGRGVLPAAAEALFGWRMHRAAGLRVRASAVRAAPGVTVTSRIRLGLVRIDAPCRVVWTVAEDDRVGFGYGTLPGHPASGEEAFVLTRTAGGEVWFTVTAFSNPARWYTRAAGPAGAMLQRWYARRYARALRRLVREQPR